MINAVLAIDIGGTNSRVAVVDKDINIIKKATFITNPENPCETCNNLISVCQKFSAEYLISKIGICAPGPFDTTNTKIGKSPNLPGWLGFKILEYFQSKFLIPVSLENDANCAALGENFLKGSPHSTLFYTISTGFGAGFVYNGELYRGFSSNAFEIQNTPVILFGRKFKYFDYEDTLESSVSGTGLKCKANKFGFEVLSSAELFRNSNDEIEKFLDEATDLIANQIISHVYTLNPEIIILGGSVITNNLDFFKSIKKKVGKKTNVILELASLDGNSGLIGTAIIK